MQLTTKKKVFNNVEIRIMPGRTDILTDNDDNNRLNHHNINNNMNSGEHSGGETIYTFQAMAGSNPDRYLSNESLETNSSGESNLGNIQHRKVGNVSRLSPMVKSFLLPQFTSVRNRICDLEGLSSLVRCLWLRPGVYPRSEHLKDASV